MPEPTLQFLGEQIARIQAELRDLRGVRSDVAHLRAEISDVESRLGRQIAELENRFAKLEDRFAELENRFAKLDDRFANTDRATQAEFALMRQTTATNLEILLAAIAGRA
jgi:prefoldin subunit 5